MKKVFWMLFFALSAALAVTGCGADHASMSVQPQEEETETFEEASSLPASDVTESGVSGNMSEIEIILDFGEGKATAVLDDSQTSRDFISLLPLTLDMTRFYDREYAGILAPAALSQDGEAIDDFENGDVTYYVAGNALAVFFDREEESSQGGLIRMGKITSDLNELVNLTGDARVTITLAEREGGNTMTEFDFSDLSNVELIGAEPEDFNGEELAVLYQQARFCQAMTDADIDTLRELVSEDMVFTHMSGRQQSREEYFADIANGSLKYFTIGMENPVVEVDGDKASVTYTSVLNANAYGARGTYRMSGTHWYTRRASRNTGSDGAGELRSSRDENRDGEWIAVNGVE